MKKIELDLAGARSEIFIGSGCIADASGIPGRKLVVVDSCVSQIYGKAARQLFPDAEFYEFPAGEKSKNPETVIGLCRFAAQRGFDRQSSFVALGGGVTGDLTGFAAAVYMRGVKVYQLPTTLLAMVDSSIGGKTGVDIPEGKNLVGAFHQPRQVFIDPDFLRTLPAAELRSGLAEAVKSAVILDETLFSRFEELGAALAGEPDFRNVYPELIYRVCSIKARIVAEDEREAGVRALLNYGHTFGHAVETLGNFTLHHGLAVALGMTVAARLAVRLGRFSPEAEMRQKHLLEALGMPTVWPQNFAPEAAVEVMKRDKKNRNGEITVVLPRRIGAAEVVRNVPERELLAAIGECR